MLGSPETCPWHSLLTDSLLSSPPKVESLAHRELCWNGYHPSSQQDRRSQSTVYQTTSKSHGREGGEMLTWIPSSHQLSSIHHRPKPPAHLDLRVQLLYLQLLPLHDLKGKVIKKARRLQAQGWSTWRSLIQCQLPPTLRPGCLVIATEIQL